MNFIKKHSYLFVFAVLLAVPFGSAKAAAQAEIGQQVPAFTATDSNGTTHSISDFRGKYVVLEWTNHQCPFVQKHYDSGNMQALQRDMTGQGVVWLSVISSAPGKQGHVSGEKADELMNERNAAPTAVLLDESGEIGRMFGARTTPQMVIIDKQGVVRYNGAIDDKPTTDTDDIEGAMNYVRAAFKELQAGEPVEVASTTPYGCSVKY